MLIITAVPGHNNMAAASLPGLFSAPTTIRSLFKSFPLAVHPAEALPSRARDIENTLPRLYVFTHERDAELGLPSYNPSCLKWQVCIFGLTQILSSQKVGVANAKWLQIILKIANVDFQLVPSSNHASPSGALPFLILPSMTSTAVPLTGEKIARFAKEHAPRVNLDDPSPQIDAYQALIAHSVRPAWVQKHTFSSLLVL